jgi:hypothetical protein
MIHRGIATARAQAAASLFVVLLSAHGCNATVVVGQDSAAASADAPPVSDVPAGSDAAPGAAGTLSALCSASGYSQAPAMDEQEFRARLAERFLLCGTESAFGRDQGDVGLEITSDGHFYRLYLGPTDGTERGTGFDREGTWQVIDTSDVNGPGSFQLNLDLAGVGTVITHPEFTTMPRKMRLNNNGVFIGTYVTDER